MNPMLYWVVAAVVSLTFAGLAVWASQRGGRSLLTLTWAISAALLLIVGYIDWRHQSPVETPLITYVLLALMPTGAAAGLVAFLSARPTKPAIQILAAAVVSFVLMAGSLASSFYP